MIRVVCDETNNTKESLEQGYLFADIYIPVEPYYTLSFEVDKDGKITFK